MRTLSLVPLVLIAACTTMHATAETKFHPEPPKREVGGAAELETQRYSRVIHVRSGAPEGDGTAERPLGTLTAALDAAATSLAAGEPTRVVLAAGVYREPHNTLYGDAGATLRNTPLLIEGESKGAVIITGSQPFEGAWTPGEGGRYTAPWPYAMEPKAQFLDRSEDEKGAIGYRRECVYVDGAPLRQVLAASELAPGRFIIDDAAATITAVPPAGVDLTAAVVEVAVGQDDGKDTSRPLLDFSPYSWENKQPKHAVTLRNLVFQHSNQRYGNYFAVRMGPGSLVEDCIVRHVNSSAMSLMSDSTVRRSEFSDAGAIGIFTWGVENVLVQDCVFRRNNWRGYAAGYTGWFVGAMKNHVASNMRIERVILEDNNCVGLWWDLWCYHVTIDQCDISGQDEEPGLLFELSRKFVVRDTRIRDCLEGIRLHDSGDHLFERVELVNNVTHVMVFSFDGRTWGDSSPGQRGGLRGEAIFPQNVRFRDCRFVSVADARHSERAARSDNWLGLYDFGVQVPFYVTPGTPEVERTFYRTLELQGTTFATEGGGESVFVGPTLDLLDRQAWESRRRDWRLLPGESQTARPRAMR